MNPPNNNYYKSIIPNPANVPEELKKLPKWLCWKWVPRKGKEKPDKPPISPHTGEKCDAHNPSNWTDFDSACAAAKRWKCDGVGFVPTADDPYTAVDLDNCWNPETSTIEQPWAQKIVDVSNSYTEGTPSGNGLRVWVCASMDKLKGHKKTMPNGGMVEFYDSKQYLTVTGYHLAGTPKTIEARQEELNRLHGEFFPAAKTPVNTGGDEPQILTDEQIMETMFGAKNGDKVRQLFDGDMSEYGNDHSRADMALCSHFAFYTRNYDQIERLFGSSALGQRGKWTEREDYHERTIRNALKLRAENDAADLEAAADESPKPWPTPEPIQGTLPPVEPFNIDLLPKSLQRLALDIAERMQVPVDFTAVALVCGVAAVVNRRARIQPKAKDDSWQEVPNLWGAIVAPPGFKKTPIIQAVMSPLHKIEREWRSKYEDDLKFYAVKKEEYALRKKDYEKKMKNGETPEVPEEPKEPALQQLIVNDATFEALHQIMSKNEAGVFVFRDELTGWLSQLDQHGREGERGFFLQSWDGKSSYTLNRIQRGNIYVPACCLSMFGGIQPDCLGSYLADAVKSGPGKKNDGMIQRFQVTVYPDPCPDYEYVDRPPDKEAAELAEQIFRKLVKLDPAKPARYRFTPDAQELFARWFTAHEERVRKRDDHPAFISHLSKYGSLMVSLALLFELADRAAAGLNLNTEADNLVSLEHAQQAVLWCEYLESHARRVYSCLRRPEVSAAAELAEKITQGKLAQDGFFTCREIQRRQWSGLDTQEAVRQAVNVLKDAGWVRFAGAVPGPSGGRSSERHEVNPVVLVESLI